MNRTLILTLYAIVATASVSFAAQAFATGTYSEPTAAPPGNNAYAPLDTSSNANVKDGGLWIAHGTGLSNGLIVENGNVGIDTTNPTVALTVNGSINETGKFGSAGKDPDSGYPSGWGGGVHTWDVYAEGSVGTGSNGTLAAYMNSSGTISGNQVSGSKFCLGGSCITSWPTSSTPPATTSCHYASDPNGSTAFGWYEYPKVDIQVPDGAEYSTFYEDRPGQCSVRLGCAMDLIESVLLCQGGTLTRMANIDLGGSDAYGGAVAPKGAVCSIGSGLPQTTSCPDPES